MKRFSLILLALVAVLPMLGAQNLEVQNERVANAFAKHIDHIIASFDEHNTGQELAYQFALTDVDGDGINECVVADINMLRCIFKVVGDDVHLISQEVGTDLNWMPISDVYTYLGYDLSNDCTMKYRPLFAGEINIKKNRFTVPHDLGYIPENMNSKSYNRMIFKPHVGNVHLVSTKGKGNETTRVYALDNAADAKKMFRGYSDNYAVPILVPAAFLKNHNPLQFTRWLQGEPQKTVSKDVRNLITTHYFGMKIREIRWLASCAVNERSFYEVVFEPKDGNLLMALVCIAEGEVVSARNAWYGMDENDPKYLAFGMGVDEVMYFAPEIMAMIAGETGLELYVRWPSLEGIHYSIWREVADQWITITDDYHYVMAY